MCGRYQFDWSEELPAMLRLQELAAARFPKEPLPTGEICPSMAALALIGGAEKIDLALLQWGYPLSGRLLINARSETAPIKALFRQSFEESRCLLPATGFFEWNENKERYLFSPKERELLYLGGLVLEGGRFVILTRDANGSVSFVHKRMPLLIPQRQVRSWVYDTAFAADFCRRPGMDVNGKVG